MYPAEITLIAILYIFSAVFSASETAFSSVSHARLKNLAAQNNRHAEKALRITEKYDKALTAILIGNNIVNIAAASVGTILFSRLLGETAVGISTLVMTVLVLIFGEIVPKSFAKEHAESVALYIAPLLEVLLVILFPLVWIFSGLARLISNAFAKNSSRPSVTEDELKYIIDEIEEEGVLEEQEGDLVRSALEFDEIHVGEIIVPRVNVVGIELNTAMDDVCNLFLSEMYSRMPVFEKSLDNIVGIITEKDFFRLLVNKEKSFDSIIQEVCYFSELKPISEALREMQKSKCHLAVVLDQYGGTKGIVTLEDIIEELVGEIYDENDEVSEALIKTGEGTYEVDAELSIGDMLDKLDLPDDIIESSATSVGGWAVELLGHIAERGDMIRSGRFTLTVLETDGQKLVKLLLSIDSTDESNNEEDDT